MSIVSFPLRSALSNHYLFIYSLLAVLFCGTGNYLVNCLHFAFLQDEISECHHEGNGAIQSFTLGQLFGGSKP